MQWLHDHLVRKPRYRFSSDWFHKKMKKGNVNLYNNEQLKDKFAPYRIAQNQIIVKEKETGIIEEDLNEDLQKIQTAGKNLLDIVNNILDISKLETGDMELNLETFQIMPMIEEIVAACKLLVGQNKNQLKVEYSQDIGSMYGDLTKIRQCLLNLLSNAAKFTKEGIITFEINRENFEDQDWIYFQVKDTGIGIPLEQQNELFSTFKQVDSSATRKFDGAGLGLAIAKQYCEMMGGTITLESELGKGSTFCLKLPSQIKNIKA